MANTKQHPNRLAFWRNERCLTQAEVSKLLDIDVTTVSKHESGDRAIPHEMVDSYAKLYKVSSYELFFERETSRQTESTE